MVSSATLRVSSSGRSQLGHCWKLDRQREQMLWPAWHSVMGGRMYSRHSGQVSIWNTLWRTAGLDTA
jgi:hypothetical protein